MDDLSKDDLDVLVSKAILSAEKLEDAGLEASQAWSLVMLYETQLSKNTEPDSVPGGVARVGAVRAALAAGRAEHAIRLANAFYNELSAERRHAIDAALKSAGAWRWTGPG